MGIVQAKIPKVPKVLVWPADIVHAPTNAFAFVVAAQDASESASDPSIERLKGFPVAVLEIFKPSFARFIDVRNNRRHTAAIAASGLASDGVFELVQALLTRPAGAFLEMVSEKFKAVACMSCAH